MQQHNDNFAIQFEAIAAMATIGGVHSEHIRALVEAGAIPHMLELMQMDAATIDEEYGKWRYEQKPLSEICRQLADKKRVDMKPDAFVRLLTAPGGIPLQLMRKISELFFVHKMCRPTTADVHAMMPCLVPLMHHPDAAIVARNACHAVFSHRGRKDWDQLAADCDIFGRLVALLDGPSVAHQKIALRTLAVIGGMSGTSDSNVFKRMATMLQKHEKETKWTLAMNKSRGRRRRARKKMMTNGNTNNQHMNNQMQQCNQANQTAEYLEELYELVLHVLFHFLFYDDDDDALIESDILPIIMRKLAAKNTLSQVAITNAILIIGHLSKRDYAKYIIENGAIEALYGTLVGDTFTSDDDDGQYFILMKILSTLWILCIDYSKGNEKGEKAMKMIVDAGALEQIRRFANHSNEHVREYANNLLRELSAQFVDANGTTEPHLK